MVSDVLKLLRSLVVAIVEFLAPRARLAAENLLLRQQLVILRRAARRPRVKPLSANMPETPRCSKFSGLL